MQTFRKEAMFCSDAFELVSYLFLLGPVHTVQLVSYHSIFYYPETKEMIYESVNLKGAVYSQKKTLSAFSLSSLVQVLQMLARSFIKLIH